MIDNFDKLAKNKLIGKSFKFWENLKNEKEDIIISEKKKMVKLIMKKMYNK